MLVQKLLSIAQVSGQAVLYILLLLSVISIGIIIERFIYFRMRRIDAAKVGRKVVDYLREGDVEGARTYLHTLPGVEADVIRESLTWYADGYDAVEQVISGGIKERRKSYEAGLLFLGTLGNNAPFVGLLGTVIGVIVAFADLAEGSNKIQMDKVMGGIAEALIATAVGLFVAIPAVVAFNVYQKKITDIEDNVGSISKRLSALLAAVGTFDDSPAPGPVDALKVAAESFRDLARANSSPRLPEAEPQDAGAEE
jgi:biopolymer transport protein ExbB/TolQ